MKYQSATDVPARFYQMDFYSRRYQTILMSRPLSACVGNFHLLQARYTRPSWRQANIDTQNKHFDGEKIDRHFRSTSSFPFFFYRNFFLVMLSFFSLGKTKTTPLQILCVRTIRRSYQCYCFIVLVVFWLWLLVNVKGKSIQLVRLPAHS